VDIDQSTVDSTWKEVPSRVLDTPSAKFIKYMVISLQGATGEPQMRSTDPNVKGGSSRS
jgi:hypothetical protein